MEHKWLGHTPLFLFIRSEKEPENLHLNEFRGNKFGGLDVADPRDQS